MMKSKSTKISANEINRFVYCPYQWYYGKCYGQRVLKEKYQALDHKTSQHEGNFVKGLKFHKKYYKAYRRRRLIAIVVALLVILVGLWVVTKWY